MDWVIRVINGPDQGLERLLQPGANLVGRGKSAVMKLSPEDVSWEHAVITRDGDEYYVENLSAQGTWVGDSRVNGRVRLKPRDRVRLSEETVLRVEPAGGGGGSRGLLITVLIVMLGALAAVVFYQIKAGSSQPDDWAGAYHTLAPWLKQQAVHHDVPPEAADLFQDAWRLEGAGDYEHSQTVWLRLLIVLSAPETRLHCAELAAKDPQDKALQSLLSPPPSAAPSASVPPSPSDDDCAAALGEFVRRRLKFSTEQAGGSSLLKPS